MLISPVLRQISARLTERMWNRELVEAGGVALVGEVDLRLRDVAAPLTHRIDELLGLFRIGVVWLTDGRV
jgi:hypothetical protein